MIGFPLTKARVVHSTTDYAILLCITYTCKMELFCVRFIASCKLCKSLGQGPDSGPFPWIKMISYDIPVSSLYTSEKGFFMLPYFTSHNATSIMFVILTHNPCSYELKQHACCHGGLISRCIRTYDTNIA